MEARINSEYELQKTGHRPSIRPYTCGQCLCCGDVCGCREVSKLPLRWMGAVIDDMACSHTSMTHSSKWLYLHNTLLSWWSVENIVVLTISEFADELALLMLFDTGWCHLVLHGWGGKVTRWMWTGETQSLQESPWCGFCYLWKYWHGRKVGCSLLGLYSLNL